MLKVRRKRTTATKPRAIEPKTPSATNEAAGLASSSMFVSSSQNVCLRHHRAIYAPEAIPCQTGRAALLVCMFICRNGRAEHCGRCSATKWHHQHSASVALSQPPLAIFPVESSSKRGEQLQLSAEAECVPSALQKGETEGLLAQSLGYTVGSGLLMRPMKCAEHSSTPLPLWNRPTSIPRLCTILRHLYMNLTKSA